MAGRPLRPAVPAHRPAEGRRRPRRRRHVDHLRRAPPRAAAAASGLTEVTIATCEPLDIGWVAEIEAHTRKRRASWSSPARSRSRATRPSSTRWRARCAPRIKTRRDRRRWPASSSWSSSARATSSSTPTTRASCRWSTGCGSTPSTSAPPTSTSSRAASCGVIRFRIDGVMHTVYQLPPGVMNAMIARIKLLGRMDVVEKRRPLDGRIKTRNPRRRRSRDAAVDAAHRLRREDGDAHLRPRHHGQDARRRWASAATTRKRWEELIAQPHGIILVTGPTGSRQDDDAVLDAAGAWRPTRSTSAPSKTRSR